MIQFLQLALPRSITMRDPVLGDSQDHVLGLVVHTAMSGRMVTHRKTPVNVVLNMKFEDLSRVKALEFRDFLVATAGMQLRFVDSHGVSWDGFVTNDPAEFTVDGRGPGRSDYRKEGTSIEVQFEVVT